MGDQEIFDLIEELVLLHSPSGDEREVDFYLMERFARSGARTWQDASGNIVAFIKGRTSERSLAITAHKDEIGMIVKTIEADGRLRVRALGGSFPWVYGEGAVDVLGDRRTLTGVLSFGSRHVSHESPQKAQQNDAPLKWADAWIDTKLTTDELADAGVRPGSRVVVGRHRKRPFRLGEGHIASYTLDNKASLAILLALLEGDLAPDPDLYLVATAKEEVGCLGAMHFSARQPLDELIALEVGPVAPEYPIVADARPVILSQDGYGLYDEDLNARLERSAQAAGLAVQRAIISGFGSDGSLCMKNGHVGRAACLCFATENTHGYEITSLAALQNLVLLLRQFLNSRENSR